jgi:HK97 family phage major capsid protein
MLATAAHPGFPAEIGHREAEAVQRVGELMLERALSEGTPGGGYAVPVDIDPTILLSSSGEINSLRSVATIRTTTSNKWTGVSSEGVVAVFEDEGTEVGK